MPTPACFSISRLNTVLPSVYPPCHDSPFYFCTPSLFVAVFLLEKRSFILFFHNHISAVWFLACSFAEDFRMETTHLFPAPPVVCLLSWVCTPVALPVALTPEQKTFPVWPFGGSFQPRNFIRSFNPMLWCVNFPKIDRDLPPPLTFWVRFASIHTPPPTNSSL